MDAEAGEISGIDRALFNQVVERFDSERRDDGSFRVEMILLKIHSEEPVSRSSSVRLRVTHGIASYRVYPIDPRDRNCGWSCYPDDPP